MSLNLSNLKPAPGAVKSRKRVGRGGKRGTYSGHGMKGQKARSGGSSGLKALGFKQTLQRTPKSRGFKSLKIKPEVVNLSDLEAKFASGDVVDARKLIDVGLISGSRGGVKVLGSGQLTKKLNVIVGAYSRSAKEAIAKVGGTAEIRAQDIPMGKKK